MKKKTTKKNTKTTLGTNNSVGVNPPLPALRGPYSTQTPTFDPEVEALTVQQLMQAQEAMAFSQVLWQAKNIIQSLNNGYPLNKWEQQIIEELTDRYNILYKTKLAESLK